MNTKKPRIEVVSRSALGGWTIKVYSSLGAVTWKMNADTVKEVQRWLDVAAQWRKTLILAHQRKPK
jgi:hypothetical protein